MSLPPFHRPPGAERFGFRYHSQCKPWTVVQSQAKESIFCDTADSSSTAFFSWGLNQGPVASGAYLVGDPGQRLVVGRGENQVLFGKVPE